MRRIALAALVVVALGLLLLALAWRPAIDPVSPPATFPPQLVQRGARLAAVGDCASCHTVPHGASYAGGVPVPTPFGVVYGTNITPEPRTGIGAWSKEAFVRAMREGVAREGRHLYPAFPYDHFRLLSNEDLDALYAYLMTRDPVIAPPRHNEMKFPFNLRPLLAGWKLLFLDRDHALPVKSDGQEANKRGAYLVAGLGHCGACHTPRNALGAEELSRPLQGGEAEGWYAPPLDSHSPSPQPWTTDALVQYLRTGIAPGHAIAGGPMRNVVTSLQDADDADVRAVAQIIVSGMAGAPATSGNRAAASAQRAARPLADVPSNEPRAALGSRVYTQACASCHDAPHRGDDSSAALRLPLAVALYDDDPRSFLRIVLDGVPAPRTGSGRWMPGFRGALTDEQVEALAAFLREAGAAMPPWPKLSDAVKEVQR